MAYLYDVQQRCWPFVCNVYLLPFRWDKRISKLHIGKFAPAEESNWPAANIERGTEPHAVHFTSGLWSLFHMLSVSSAPMRLQPDEIMEGIHSFVEYFFR